MTTHTKRDYYEVLGVPRDAPLDQIKRAYRKLAVENHPDRNPGNPEAEERFKEASEAYAVLSDADKRASYDRFGHQGVGGDPFAGFDPTSFGDFADILGDLFGFGDLFGGRRRSGRTGPRRGRDLQYTLSLTLEEAATGIERPIRIPRLEQCAECNGSGQEAGTEPEVCSACNGQGQVMFRRGFLTVAQTCPSCRGQGRLNRNPCSACGGRGQSEEETTLKVKVPAGVETGMRLRLTGEGEGGVRGGPAGDLYVIMSVHPHELFVREGADLHLEVPVSVFRAILGGPVKVATVLGEEREVDVKAGSQPGDVVRLRGMGMPQLNGHRRGDLLVHLKVLVPRKLSAEQRAAVERAAELQPEPAEGDGGGFFERVKRALGGEG